MRLFGLFSLFFISSVTLSCNAYRILGIFPYNGPSHFIMCERLMRGLAERGHQVDIVSHFPLTKPIPNYNDIIDLSSTGSPSIVKRKSSVTYELLQEYIKMKSISKLIATEFGVNLCQLMDDPRLKKLINNPPSDPSYDLVITEVLGAHCYMAIGQHLGIPVVGIVTSVMLPWANDIVANPAEPAYVPHVFSGLGGEMNFWQRLSNSVELFKERWQFNYHSEYQTDMIAKHIGPHAPSVREAERNVSLILVNSHFSINGARPFTTAVVEVGGLHIPDSVKELPIELQQWLDDSVNGFVYISFGSMIKIESFPEESLRALYASLAKLAPTRVLMRVANATELPHGLPNNVITEPWIPQLAVLKHENIRIFMTHGGLMGTQEAIYCGVPMIGVPILADQGHNIQTYVHKHVAVSIDFNELTEKNLDAAFNAILDDPTYIESAKKLSAEFRDRPMPPLDTAIFWVEYVIRYGGKNLRSLAMNLTWWQIRLLDVYAAIFLAVVLTVLLIKFIVNKLITTIINSQLNNTIKSDKWE